MHHCLQHSKVLDLLADSSNIATRFHEIWPEGYEFLIYRARPLFLKNVYLLEWLTKSVTFEQRSEGISRLTTNFSLKHLKFT